MDLFGSTKDKRTDDKEGLREEEITDEGRLSLKEEQLDIAKDREQTGEVILTKDVEEIQQTVNVPVTHEEVVIERRDIDNEFSDEPIGMEQTIRIPVSEEHVEVGKHTVVTGEVSAHKKAVEETERIDETLKKERARVETSGDPNIVDNGGMMD